MYERNYETILTADNAFVMWLPEVKLLYISIIIVPLFNNYVPWQKKITLLI